MNINITAAHINIRSSNEASQQRHRRWQPSKANYIQRPRRARLNLTEFASANDQKAAWVKAAIHEYSLTGHEPKLLEVIAYLTDPVTGEGNPYLSTIHKEFIDPTNKNCYSGGSLSDRSVSRIMSRLVKKGVITRTKHYKGCSTYRLVGYEYKSCDPRDKVLRISKPTPLSGRVGFKNKSKSAGVAQAYARSPAKKEPVAGSFVLWQPTEELPEANQGRLSSEFSKLRSLLGAFT